MAKGDTFFLRTKLTSDSTNYVSDTIDISAYTDPARGRVLVIDRAVITFGTDGNGPINAADVGSGAATKAMGAQACSEVQTAFVEMSDNSLFMRSNIYASTITGPYFSLLEQTDSLNPAEYVNGFIIPTDGIHCGIDATSAWAAELDVGFLFEVHTEKLSLRRIQELLVSLTAN